jgi:hypothetical protein
MWLLYEEMRVFFWTFFGLRQHIMKGKLDTLDPHAVAPFAQVLEG